jgi:hypothetical protein
VALIVLVTNDHVFKGSAWMPGWFTGKASDFAGLFLAPLVLVALARRFGVTSERVPLSSATVVAAGFVLLKTCPPVCAFYSHWIGSTVCDPTDLMALPCCFLGVLWKPRSPHLARSPRGGVLQRALLVVSSLACMATSKARPPVAPVAPVGPAPDWGGLGCASVRLVGDRISGRAAEVVIEVKNDSGKNGCVLHVGVSETIMFPGGSFGASHGYFEVHTKATVAVGPGQVVNTVVPLELPREASCASPRSMAATLNEGDANIPRIAYRDSDGKDHGSASLVPAGCLPSAPLAAP